MMRELRNFRLGAGCGRVGRGCQRMPLRPLRGRGILGARLSRGVVAPAFAALPPSLPPSLKLRRTGRRGKSLLNPRLISGIPSGWLGRGRLNQAESNRIKPNQTVAWQAAKLKLELRPGKICRFSGLIRPNPGIEKIFFGGSKNEQPSNEGTKMGEKTESDRIKMNQAQSRSNFSVAGTKRTERMFYMALKQVQKELGIVRNIGLVYLSEADYSRRDYMATVEQIGQIFHVSKESVRIRFKTLRLIQHDEINRFTFLEAK
jgi:hypothetical protein